MYTNKIIVFDTDRSYLVKIGQHLANKESVSVDLIASRSNFTDLSLKDYSIAILRVESLGSKSVDAFDKMEMIKNSYPNLNLILSSDKFNNVDIFNAIARGAFNCLNLDQLNFLDELDEFIYRINQMKSYSNSESEVKHDAEVKKTDV